MAGVPGVAAVPQKANSRAANAEREAEAALKELGAQIHRDDNGQVLGVWINDPRFADEHIVQLRTLSWSKTSSTGPPPVDDSYPALGVFGTQVTVTGLEQIQGMTQFTYLALTNNTDITDDSLERLKGLTKIKRLNLRGTSITDDGLKRLKRLTDLEQLNLSGTKVTDAGLKHLNTLTSLEELRPAFCS